MSFVICAAFLCLLISQGIASEEKISALSNLHLPELSPLEFPTDLKDVSTPMLIGSDPKQAHMPPLEFPNQSPYHNSTGPPILSGNIANITEIKHIRYEAKLKASHKNTTIHETSAAVVESATKPSKVNNKTDKFTLEQEDMLHSKYKGGQDVDELLNLPKKASEKEEKKLVSPKDDPKSEVIVGPTFDKNGPKLMNDTKLVSDTNTKSGESVFESTSKVMAVSSSVLAGSNPKHHGIIEPTKTFVSVLLSAAVILCLGFVGLLVWKKISMRRYGRDVLINEDDFDDIADMHTFDRAQIHIT